MDLRLHLLDSFVAQAADGSAYKVCAYERMVPDLSLPQEQDHWEPTGELEYRLEDGHPVQLQPDGSLRVAGTGLLLHRRDGSAASLH